MGPALDRLARCFVSPLFRLRAAADPAAALALPALLFVWVAAAGPAGASDDAWLGIYTEPLVELPPIEERAGGPAALQGATAGLRVEAVIPHSPAEEGGLRVGDIIVAAGDSLLAAPRGELRALFSARLERYAPGDSCRLRVIRDAVARAVVVAGAPLAGPPERSFWRDAAAWIDSLDSGETLSARASKQQALLELTIVLGVRPSARWPAPPSNVELFDPATLPESDFAPLVAHLAAASDTRTELSDLNARLARCHRGRDPYRLDAIIYTHRDPLRLESYGRSLANGFGRAECLTDLLDLGHAILRPGISSASKPSRPGGQPAADREPALACSLYLDVVERVLDQAASWLEVAFADLSEEERTFLRTQRWELTDYFATEIYLHFDDDRDRFERNERLIRLARRIDFDALHEAANRCAHLTDAAWAAGFGHAARAACADTLDRPVLLRRDTRHGPLLVCGAGNDRHRNRGAAFLLDIGGDDVYAGGAGAGGSGDRPISLGIDLAGNDAYTATRHGAQGAGTLGLGGWLDVGGEDTYVGIDWAQGVGYLGVGWLIDADGDDRYYGRAFCQGVGLFGLGLLLDRAGTDRYDGGAHVQGVGLAQGVGLLLERGGDDEFYAKGLYETNYGNEGIFDAWSQGCATGFRTIASGGLGLLLDEGGADRMEAGNFSQGGGYYYGLGLLIAEGNEDDLYIGSRYNQGFSAHQALGCFLEAGGNDRYQTHQGVAQGLAWDECVTLFIDQAGDDRYEGGDFFSLGAAAHNSFCFFLDRGGDDRYDYTPGPARAGGNSYHGGTSFSLFLDEGGGDDRYGAAHYGNGAAWHRPEHGFFLDLNGRLPAAELPALRPFPSP